MCQPMRVQEKGARSQTKQNPQKQPQNRKFEEVTCAHCASEEDRKWDLNFSCTYSVWVGDLCAQMVGDMTTVQG